MIERSKIINMQRAKQRYIIGIMLIFTVALGFFVWYGDEYKKQENYKEKLIRFHVLANSDAPKDQEIKFKIRDRIIREMNPLFEQSESLDNTRNIIKENLGNIERITREEIAANGGNYSVKATLNHSMFPAISYANTILPAGKYEALRVVVGKGEGSNWWCVLFPPLCFIDIKNVEISDKTKNELMKVLTEEEFKRIQSASIGEGMPIKLKFKVVEIIEQARANFGKIVGLK
ncbi:MAG: stage II sporulation protein R [Alkaliphilus sp.]|nr:stage II sporulation protein R [Alkaliphilus sp.]